MARVYKQEIIDELLRLRLEGNNYKEIQRLTGINEITVSKYCRAAGLGKRPLTEQEASTVDKIRELVNGGMENEKISKEIGLSVNQISYIRQAHGIHRNDPDGHKRCPRCGELKPYSEYGELKRGYLGISYACKECRKVADSKVDRSRPKEFVTFTCKWCGKRYSPKRDVKYNTYCSRECAFAAKADNAKEKTCARCGAKYKGMNGRQECHHVCDDCCDIYIKNDRKWTLKCKSCGSRFKALSLLNKYCEICSTDDAFRARAREYALKHFVPVPKTVHTCQECGADFIGQAGMRYCSRKCSSAVSKRLRRALKMNNGSSDRIVRSRLVERDGPMCGICGEEIDLSIDPHDNMAVSIDHIVPLANGGTHTYDNVQLAHRICNSRKGAKLIEQLENAI